jgi:hypothetical protein
MQNSSARMLGQESMIAPTMEKDVKYCMKITDTNETIDRLYEIILNIRQELVQSEEKVALMEKNDMIKTDLIRNLRYHMSEKDTLIEKLSIQNNSILASERNKNYITNTDLIFRYNSQNAQSIIEDDEDDEEDNLDPNGAMPQFNFMLGNI